MLRNVLQLALLLSFLAVQGCSITAPETLPNSTSKQMGNLLLAEPAPANARFQVDIARYSHILSEAELNQEETAMLLFRRGVLYDSVGLAGLANFDFTRALNYKPDMAEAFNYIGVYFTQQSEFEQAYEAFDSTLEINPEYDFALLNRGIALYYGGRSALALNDLTSFIEKNPSDPFRVLWDYFARYEVDPIQAQQTLQLHYPQVDAGHWAIALIELFLGKKNEQQVLSGLLNGIETQKQLTDRLCEAYFYLGKFNARLGDYGKAKSYFKLALSTNVYDYVEHKYARLELNRLRNNGQQLAQ